MCVTCLEALMYPLTASTHSLRRLTLQTALPAVFLIGMAETFNDRGPIALYLCHFLLLGQHQHIFDIKLIYSLDTRASRRTANHNTLETPEVPGC